MTNVRGDTLMRRLRKEKGMTLVQLCEGICTKETLSNIENGKRPPNRWVFKQLMERLGENPNKYFVDVVTLEDRRIADLKEKLKGFLHEKSDHGIKKAGALIEEMEQDEAFASKENQQFLLMKKASLAFLLGNACNMYNYALEAIKITKPHFDDSKIESYAMSLDEVWLINQFAIACFLKDLPEKSAGIFTALKSAIDRRDVYGDELINTYASLLYNLSKNLSLLKRYEECLNVCDEGIEWSTKHRNSFHHPLFMSNKSYCLLHLGRKEEAVGLLKMVYAIFMGFGRYSELSQIKNYVEMEFDIKIDSLDIPS